MRRCAILYNMLYNTEFKANKLRQSHPEAAEQIYDLQRQINEQWTLLTQKANSRKEKLLDSYGKIFMYTKKLVSNVL